MSNSLIKIQKENLPCLAVNQIGLFSQYNIPQQSKAIIEIERNVDLDQTLNLPVIQRLGKESKQDVLLMIERALRMTTSMFKYAEKMEDYQISMMASDLYDKFSYNTVEDIILMLRYIRQGKLGGSKSVFDNDTLFNIYVPKYLDMKAEKWEKENEFIVDKTEDIQMTVEEKEKQQKWLDELHNSWKAERKPKLPEVFEPVDHHAKFISDLKQIVGSMTNEQLEVELMRAKNNKVWDAHEIYNNELKKKKVMNDKGEKITVGDALLHEYKAVKLEKEKGATVYGLFYEPIDELLERLERQLKDLGVFHGKSIV